MKTTKDILLDYLKEEAAKGKRNLDTKTISNALGMQRSNVSSLLNQLVEEGQVEKTKTRPVYYSLSSASQEQDSFAKLIGNQQSLSNAVQLAKAAILYPGKPLNTLIIGSVGTGKSYLARLMFDFAKQMGKIDSEAELQKINCRHFVNNREELLESLFGVTSKFGNLFDAAENGILFIDNIEYLDGSGLARINEFIETGQLQYLDGSRMDKKNVTLIISMNEKTHFDVLQRLSSKISIHIELPDLKDRELEEKLELINNFFMEEAKNTQYDIAIEPDVLLALILFDSQNNLKFLYGSIKVAVANAYLRNYDNKSDTIQVVMSDFDRNVSEALLLDRTKRYKIAKIIPKSFTYSYSKKGEQLDFDLMGRDFYDHLSQRVLSLQRENHSKDQINEIVGNEINNLIIGFKEEIQKAEINFNQLSKVVDPTIIKLVTDFIKECQDVLKVEYPNSVIYGLALHVHSIISSKRETKYLSQEKITEIITHHQAEFEQAKILVNRLEKLTNKELSDDEKVIIAMFLIHREDQIKHTNPQVLIAMHGDSGATSVANVVNDLVKISNTYAYDMSLNKSSETSYRELKQLIDEIDQGKGVIVIYDMGSIKTILDRIAAETQHEIRLIYIPITLVGIEASRKASMHYDIDTVYHELLSSMRNEVTGTQKRQDALITLCHTGDGGASELKDYLQKYYRQDIKIYPLAISDPRKLVKEVQKIKRYYNIQAFIGTYDPKLYGIPFIPVSRVFEYNPEQLEHLLMSDGEVTEPDFEAMIDYIVGELDLDKAKLKKALPAVTEELDSIFALNLDKKVGLFLHLGVLVNKLVHHVPIKSNENKELTVDFGSEDIKQMKEVLKKLERTFQIIIPDIEVQTIYEIVKKENHHE